MRNIDIDKNKPFPYYRQLGKILQHQIFSGEFKTDDCIPDERSLARMYDVSRITARRAISELVKEGLLYRIRGKGTFVNPQPEEVLISQKSKKLKIVELSIDIPEGSFCSIIIKGVNFAMATRGYRLMVHDPAGNKAQEAEFIKKIAREETCMGLIIRPTVSLDEPDILLKRVLGEVHFPFVFIDNYIREVDADYVGTDNVTGAYMAVRHLVQSGHSRIAIIRHGSVNYTSNIARFSGYRKALDEAHIPYEERLVAVARDWTCYERIVDTFLKMKNRPTAIFAGCDPIALGVLKVLLEKGVRVPEDMSLVGFDDLQSSALAEVPLTTVSQPFMEVGMAAANLLIDKIEGKRPLNAWKHVNLEPRLIIRKSCGAIPAKGRH